MDVDVGKLLKVGENLTGAPLEYTGKLPVVAAFNLATPRSEEGISSHFIFIILTRFGLIHGFSYISENVISLQL